MPLYTMICRKCRKAFEALIKLADADNPVKCRYCGKKLKKIMDAPYFKVIPTPIAAITPPNTAFNNMSSETSLMGMISKKKVIISTLKKL